MKRSFSISRAWVVVSLGTAFVAATYGLVRLAFGLFLPDIQADLGLGATTAGYVSSGSSLAYCAAAACGMVLGRRMPRALVLAATTTACVGVWGMAAAGGIGVFGVSAVISSAGAGFASPALVAIVARNVDARRRDTAQSTVNAGTGPGLVVAGVLALILLPDWRLAWALIGALTAGLGVALVLADRPGTTDAGRAARPGATWARDHLGPITAATLMGAGSSAVWVYGRTVLVETGAGSADETVVAWIVLGVGATAMILTARPMAVLEPTRAWGLSGTLLTCATAALAAAPQHQAVTLVACLAFGWGFTAGTSALIAWTIAIDPAGAAAGTAMLFVALVFGQAAGATALGTIVSVAGYPTAFLAAAALAAAAVAVGVFGRRRPATSGAVATRPT